MVKSLFVAFSATFVFGCSVDALDTATDGDGSGDPGDARPVVDRVTAGVSALYDFGEAGGATLADTSGVGSPLDLTIGDPALAVVSGGKLAITAATPITSAGPATKIFGSCIGSSAVTIEAWVRPSTVTTNGRIVTASADGANRNFQIKQQDTTYVSRIRTDNNDNGQTPELVSAEGVASIAEPQHVVVTRAAEGAEVTYLNGTLSSQVENPGSHATWSVNYQLSLGSDADGANPWTGELYLVAVYCRALDAAEVAQNFSASY